MKPEIVSQYHFATSTNHSFSRYHCVAIVITLPYAESRSCMANHTPYLLSKRNTIYLPCEVFNTLENTSRLLTHCQKHRQSCRVIKVPEDPHQDVCLQISRTSLLHLKYIPNSTQLSKRCGAVVWCMWSTALNRTCSQAPASLSFAGSIP